jgi:hypothetical protein
MRGEQAIESVRTAALEAITIKSVGTKLQLPVGGTA